MSRQPPWRCRPLGTMQRVIVDLSWSGVHLREAGIIDGGIRRTMVDSSWNGEHLREAGIVLPAPAPLQCCLCSLFICSMYQHFMSCQRQRHFIQFVVGLLSLRIPRLSATTGSLRVREWHSPRSLMMSKQANTSCCQCRNLGASRGYSCKCSSEVTLICPEHLV